MLKHLDLTKERLQAFGAADKLRGRLYSARSPVKLAVYAAPGRISHQEAMSGKYEPLEVGAKLGPLWATHWVRVEIEIPEVWNGREVHLLWDSTSEACVWQDGVPRQGLTGSQGAHAHGNEPPIRPEYILSRSATGGQELTLYIEVACNHLFGIMGSASTADLTGLVRRAEIATFEREAWDLLCDYKVISEMAQHLPAGNPRAGQALYAANQIINVCDLADRKTWSQARRIAQEFLSSTNGANQHNLSAVGHAHIDSAWLWPRAETKRKCYRTFATVCRYADDYPEYKFAWPQAAQYEWMKEEQPELWKELCAKVEAGQIVPTGGSWVEPDCNIPNGESLVRQFLYGQSLFEREFGKRCRVFWNPDVFGYSGQLPQIMRSCGIDYFLTQKLSWNQFNKLPSHTFLWEGIDGSQVLTHFPPADTYNAVATVEQVVHNVTNFKDLERANESYMLFGYGDGGGGPTPEMLERIRRMNDLEGLPRVQIRDPESFFERCAADIKNPLVWVGELYFELHRGTYTTHALNKRYNRLCENLLHDAELFSAFNAITNGAEYPREGLDEAWKLVLFNQFHDILPGSSITEVYRDSTEDYQHVENRSRQMLRESLGALAPEGEDAGRVAVFNSLGMARREVVTIGDAPAVVQAPSIGYAIQQPHRNVERPVSLRETADGFVLENANLRATIRRDGGLTSLILLPEGREAIEPGRTANQLVFYNDQPNRWEAWDVDVFHLEQRQEMPTAASCRIVEQNDLRIAVEFDYALSEQSHLKQIVRLDALSRWIEFDCSVCWYESRRFLKVEFPINVRSDMATYEVQFGHLRRPTHFNQSWDMARFEVCAQRWADLGEPDFGVALLNDCKYGYATHGNVMRLSLLRSPKSPDPEADMGDHHRFRYALMPHAGSIQSAGVVAAGQRFNMPLSIHPTAAEPASISWLQVDQPAMVIDTVKRSEDGKDLIVRLYEAHGTRGICRMTSALALAGASLCNALEEELAEVAVTGNRLDLHFAPFKVMTLRLRLQPSGG